MDAGAADCVRVTGPIARLPLAALRSSTTSSTEFIIFWNRTMSSFSTGAVCFLPPVIFMRSTPSVMRSLSKRCSMARCSRSIDSLAWRAAVSALAARARCSAAASSSCLTSAGVMSCNLAFARANSFSYFFRIPNSNCTNESRCASATTALVSIASAARVRRVFNSLICALIVFFVSSKAFRPSLVTPSSDAASRAFSSLSSAA